MLNQGIQTRPNITLVLTEDIQRSSHSLTHTSMFQPQAVTFELMNQALLFII